MGDECGPCIPQDSGRGRAPAAGPRRLAGSSLPPKSITGDLLEHLVWPVIAVFFGFWVLGFLGFSGFGAARYRHRRAADVPVMPEEGRWPRRVRRRPPHRRSPSAEGGRGAGPFEGLFHCATRLRLSGPPSSANRASVPMGAGPTAFTRCPDDRRPPPTAPGQPPRAARPRRRGCEGLPSTR